MPKSMRRKSPSEASNKQQRVKSPLQLLGAGAGILRRTLRPTQPFIVAGTVKTKLELPPGMTKAVSEKLFGRVIANPPARLVKLVKPSGEGLGYVTAASLKRSLSSGKP
jgi:hypothetical protein